MYLSYRPQKRHFVFCVLRCHGRLQLHSVSSMSMSARFRDKVQIDILVQLEGFVHRSFSDCVFQIRISLTRYPMVFRCFDYPSICSHAQRGLLHQHYWESTGRPSRPAGQMSSTGSGWKQITGPATALEITSRRAGVIRFLLTSPTWQD